MDSKFDENLESFARLFEGYGTKKEKEAAANAQKSVEDLKAIQSMIQPFLVGSKAFDVKSLQNIQKKISSPSIQQFFGRNDKKALKTLQNMNASINAKIKSLEQPEQNNQQQIQQQQQQTQQNTAQDNTAAQNTTPQETTQNETTTNEQQSVLQKGAEQVNSTLQQKETPQENNAAENTKGDYKKLDRATQNQIMTFVQRFNPQDLIDGINKYYNYYAKNLKDK